MSIIINLVHETHQCIIINRNLKIKKMSQKIAWRPVKTSTESTSRPSPRWGHSSCVIGDEIVLFGGYADSVYMNDTWVFNTNSMEWREIKTTGRIPGQRSNCSLNYDAANNRLILFGGGGINKVRYNQINVLNWDTKQWSNIAFPETETAPWQRTYHSSELLYPYLIIFGGEGVADLDDLWIFNLQTLRWQQVTFSPNAVRPCGRRFHSSCLIGYEYFVIAGCHAKYRPLNDVFSIDLTKLVETGSIEGLQWKQRLFNEQGFLTRWGQACAVQDTNIYIFGGRFSNDLNDMLILDTERNKLRVLKVNNQTIPKPRRRSCLCFIGNCLLMFGGFNSDYYNDLHYINVTENQPKPKRFYNNKMEVKGLINNNQFSDLQIKSKSGKIFNCHKGILMQSFKSEKSLMNFIESINGKQDEKQLEQLLTDFYRGYGNSGLLNKYLIQLPSDYSEKENQFNKFVESFKSMKMYNQSIGEIDKKGFNNIFKLQDEQFRKFMEHNREVNYSDFVIKARKNDEYYLMQSNMMLLVENSKFFKNLFSQKYKNGQIPAHRTVDIDLVSGDFKLFQIILYFIQTGHLVVPQSLNYNSWIDIYQLADYLALSQIQGIALYQLFNKIDEYSVNDIFKFSVENKLDELGIACGRFKLNKNPSKLIRQTNKLMKISYELNRFQIKQALMTKVQPKLTKKQVSNCQDEDEDKQNNVEACQI